MKCLYLKISTWNQDSAGLFNYECNSIQKHKLEIQKSARVVDTGQSFEVVSAEQDSENTVVSIVHSHGTFIVHPPKNLRLWSVVKKSPKKSYQIKQGDVIRLGRVRFRVKKVKLSGKTLEKVFEEPLSGDGSESCRICMSNGSSPENPIITPCKCCGTMKNIHVSCLKRWIDSKLIIKPKKYSSSYYWTQLNCELCKQPLSTNFTVASEQFELMKIGNLEGPYMLLDDLRRDRKGGHLMHLVNGCKSYPVTLGRAHESDIKVNDISVSRVHAFIHFKDNKFYLRDNNSKFGTLVNNSEEVLVKKESAFQIGNSLLELKVHKQSKCMCGIFKKLSKSKKRPESSFVRIEEDEPELQRELSHSPN